MTLWPLTVTSSLNTAQWCNASDGVFMTQLAFFSYIHSHYSRCCCSTSPRTSTSCSILPINHTTQLCANWYYDLEATSLINLLTSKFCMEGGNSIHVISSGHHYMCECVLSSIELSMIVWVGVCAFTTVKRTGYVHVREHAVQQTNEFSIDWLRGRSSPLSGMQLCVRTVATYSYIEVLCVHFLHMHMCTHITHGGLPLSNILPRFSVCACWIMIHVHVPFPGTS